MITQENLFQADLSVIELGVEEIPFESLTSCLEYLSNTNLADNEHIVALFVTIYGRDEYIRDFHFLRYDKQKGWSDKRWGWRVNFIENNLFLCYYAKYMNVKLLNI